MNETQTTQKQSALAKSEAKAAEPINEKPSFKVPDGEEKLIHAIILQGRRFNPTTGKEESSPFIKAFTFGEYQVFKANATLLGYTIVQELHNPYNK